ncbi:MAG: SDR family NAD(P)-dependent oxidoreductase [Candidatus Marinimicrobia bacterium]|nr:SDR family NAD(P)-dependent oxidoreductase [Candidatus Neomarinimicrobiota bacterium]MCF7850257.1 SDR family NAD(P)-dependent oxidoreductase [Candidatus Neomarinimicrobiota bacterium]MCF7903846.1 SDR family NAD(P)-dependent oxidoreductase [Candidatus Neomarinimicrobiota bacterium]
MSEKWTTNNIPDQSGRTVIVTGSNNGIGYEAAKTLAMKNAQVILAVRDLEKGAQAKNNILKEFPQAQLQVMHLDLANLKTVDSFASEFSGSNSRLDLLINNAGIMIPPYSKTEDGFESQMGTNHLGHFALTAKLFDMLDSTPGSRIVNVSSGAHKMGNLNFDDLHWEDRRYIPWRAYGDSKISNLYFTFELRRRIESSESRVLVAVAHPGYSATGLQKLAFLKFLNIIVAQSAAMGALPTLRAATAPEVRAGDYFGPDGVGEMRGFPEKVEAKELAHDEEIASKLWAVSEELTGVTFKI